MAQEQRRNLGPPPIQTPPTGLLGFFGIKSGGRQPDQLGSQLIPTLDMQLYYEAGARQVLVGPGGGLVNVNNTIIVFGTVPQGKAWVIEGVLGFSGLAGAVAAFRGTIVLLIPNAGEVALGPTTEAAITGINVLARTDRRVIAPSGSVIGVNSSAPAAPTAFSWFPTIIGSEVAA